jgi:hypothetical protein
MPLEDKRLPIDLPNGAVKGLDLSPVSDTAGLLVRLFLESFSKAFKMMKR